MSRERIARARGREIDLERDVDIERLRDDLLARIRAVMPERANAA